MVKLVCGTFQVQPGPEVVPGLRESSLRWSEFVLLGGIDQRIYVVFCFTVEAVGSDYHWMGLMTVLDDSGAEVATKCLSCFSLQVVFQRGKSCPFLLYWQMQ